MKTYNHLRGIHMELRHPLVRSSSQLIVVSGVVLLVSCWPLLGAAEGWPFAYVSNLFAIFPCVVSLILAPAFVLGSMIELLRRGWNLRVFIAMLLSGLAVAAWVFSFVLRFRRLANGVF